MSPLEAKRIIALLANGIDPETGEILPTQSIINRPEVIRALVVAGMALEKAAKRAERDSLLPGNAGRPWSEEEDQTLLARFDSGVPAKDIAAEHGRTRGAIAARLVRLGRLTDRAEADAGAPSIMPPDHEENSGP